MDSIAELIDRILTLLLLPATLYGAGGALMHARRRGKPMRQSFVEVIGGAFTAHMLTPVVIAYVPEVWHSVVFFLVGWGGLELVGRLYEAGATALERRIIRNIGGSASTGGGDGEGLE